MTEQVPVIVPRENVNDESATLLVWSVADGDRVEAGQTVAQIETSKAVADLVTPAAGVLRHGARAGDDVPVGAAVGWVFTGGVAPRPGDSLGPIGNDAHADGETAGRLSPSVRRLVAEGGVDPVRVVGTGRGGRITKADVIAHLTEPPPSSGETRLSRNARERIRELGLDESAFAGRGLIRARDVRPAIAPGPAPVSHPPPCESPAPGRPRPVAALGVPTRLEPLSRAKRVEQVKYLRSGAETTLPTAVTVACPTRGFRDATRGDAAAVIAFEAARLLRKFPAFNAYHQDGVAYYYEEVNLGFAVDDGRGLKVPVVRDADRKGVVEIAAEMRDLFVSYLNDGLPVAALAGGTFTVTDLSGEGVTSFHPMINQGQSAILGVRAEEARAGAGAGSFNLILAFDHQLAEGRTAARFLNELGRRLRHYESAAAGADERAAEEPRCSRCGAGFRELAANNHCLLQSVRADGSTRLVCKLCFEGWV